MIIVLKPGAPPGTAEELLARIADKGLEPLHMPGSERDVLGALGDERVLAELHLESHPFVEALRPILAPYRLVSREFRPSDTVVRLGEAEIGGDDFAVVAGPDAVESKGQIEDVAEAAKAAGAAALRGGVLRYDIGRYDYEGRGDKALDELIAAGAASGLPVMTEAMSKAHLEALAGRVDAIVVGARNMGNSVMLDAAAACGTPVLLKRGVSATVEELLMAAEHLLEAGAKEVVLVERGVRTFGEGGTHLDLAAVPFVKQRTHLPILVDPSNGTGRREFVTPMALAACACGADGLMLDVHPAPAKALSGGERSLDFAAFNQLMAALAPIASAVGRHFE